MDDTMVEAISLMSPSGAMSNRARNAAQERLRVALFGVDGLQLSAPAQPTQRESNLRRAAELRALAARGMKPRAFLKEAARLEMEVA